MSALQLQAKNRDVKANIDRLRKSGQMPAELYGNKIQNLHLSVGQNEFEKVLRKVGESTIIELMTEDGQKHNVLIHDVQRHFLTSLPIHVDFLEVSMTEKLTATVALEFVGESFAVKNLGAVLVRQLDEVEVECLPGDLPSSIEVDISKLATLEDSIHVKDLSVSDKVKVVTDGEELVAKVQPPRNVEAELAEPIVEDVTKVEGVVKEEPAKEEASADKE